MTRPTELARLLSQIETLSAAVPFVVIASLMLTQNAAAQKLEDGTFDPEDWTPRGPFILPDDAPGGDVDWSQLTTGGNPDHHLRFLIEGVSVPLGESSQAWGILINENAEAVYDPEDVGSIQRIDFEFDARLPPDDIRGNRAVSLAVRQTVGEDEFLWAAIDKRVFIDEAIWTSKWIFGLTESDFTPFIWAKRGQPPTPDFSFGGEPISFGLVQGTSCPTTSDCSLTPVPSEVDIDNWKVAVNDSGLSLKLSLEQVPPPGELPELDLEFLVSATVRNAGPSEASNIKVRFKVPKEELADSYRPDTECTLTSNTDFLMTECTIRGPVGPASSDAVRVPTGVISDRLKPPANIYAGYANVVPANPDPIKSPFISLIYEAEIVSFSGGDPDPARDLRDEVIVAICNPSGIEPVLVQDGAACDALINTGGTSGSGGTAGTGGDASMGSSSSGCSAGTRASGSNPWIPLLCLAGVAIWLRRRRR
jgi:hypothetical protein